MAQKQVVEQLQKLGWSREQALGLAANFQAESNFNPSAVGDGGKAYGIAQWHPDRQAAFQAWKGKDIRAASLEEQVEFADYELRHGAEKSAGKRLLAASTAHDAASIVSQYYERPMDRVGEAQKRAKIAAGWAGTPWKDEDVVPVAPARALTDAPQAVQAAPGAANDYPRLPRYQAPAAARLSAIKDAAPLALTAGAAAQTAAEQGTVEQSRAQAGAIEGAWRADVAERAATGLGDVFTASRHDPRDQAMFTVLDQVSRGPAETPPEGWTYDANRSAIEAPCGVDDECFEYMRENVTGPSSMATAHAQVEYRKGLDKTYGMAGPWTQFLGRMGGGIMDPVGFAAGLGATKALQVAGIGSRALVAAGRPGAAVTSQIAEGALGNVSVEAIQDAMGEVKTSADYVMAASLGAIMTAPFTRGAYAQAQAKAVQDMADAAQLRAVDEQVAKVTDHMETTGQRDPRAVADAVMRQEQEQIIAAIRAADTNSVRDQAMPGDVQTAIRAEAEGDPPVPPASTEAPTMAGPDGEPVPVPPAADLNAAKNEWERIDPIMPDVAEDFTFPTIDLQRQVPDSTGKPLTLGFFLRDPKTPDSQGHTAAEVIDAVLDPKLQVAPGTRALAFYLKDTISDAIRDVRVDFGPRTTRGKFDPNTRVIDSPGGDLRPGKTTAERLQGLSPWHYETVLHEIVHAATHSKIEAYKSNKVRLSAEARAALDDFNAEFKLFSSLVDNIYRESQWKELAVDKDGVKGGKPEGMGELEYKLRYAKQNMHEFAAMAMSDPTVQKWMSRQPGTPVAGKPSSMWRNFINIVGRMILGAREGSQLANVTAALDRVIRADGSNIKYMGGEPALAGPAQRAGVAQRNYAQSLYNHAQQWLAANPIDTSRLKVLTAKFPGGMSDGLVLANSKNPILQMVSGLVTETTTGAAGRQANVSIRTAMLHRKLIGDGMLDYQNNFTTWGKTNGATLWDSVMQGQKRREFDRAVHEEIIGRRDANYTPANDSSVVAAADSLERVFERSRLAQIDAGTLGSGNLPGNSRGYVPQALDGAKLQDLSVQDLDALHTELSAQFQARLGWDATFADTFAPYYTDRIRKRSQGSKEVDAMGAGGDAMQVVRDTLDDMSIDPAMRDRMTAATKAKAGIGNTKKRLDLDLRREFVPGRMLLDVYVSDPLTLARSYARRVAGNVALTEQGILGIRGVRELREAAATSIDDGTRATLDELESYDRVMSEVLGTPVAGQVVSAGASNLQLLVSLQRLGGLAFTQAAEQFNMLHHLGLRSTMAGIAALPRMLGEVGRLKRGGPSGNSILTSIEAYGGEIGTDSYKMVAPLDPPEARLEDYVKQSGLLSRLLRSGGHLQSKISFFRGLMSAQHRAAAEQIVMRAARFIRDGGDNVALADMGFTPDVVQSMQGDLARVARWDSSGNLTAFDLTQVTDPRTAEAFVQAVHRGTSQIIQGTFIGERSKWFHNDYMRLMLQLRTFGITATEKQLQRTAMIHGGGAQGYAYVGGLMLGQMTMAMPIHAARVQLASAGREDKDQFIKDNLNPFALVRASMNYSSITGLTGDVLELTSAMAGGWLDAEGKEMIGARTGQATSVGRLVPAAGTIDTAFKVVSGKADLHTTLRQLPFSNLPYVAPALSFTKD